MKTRHAYPILLSLSVLLALSWSKGTFGSKGKRQIRSLSGLSGRGFSSTINHAQHNLVELASSLQLKAAVVTVTRRATLGVGRFCAGSGVVVCSCTTHSARAS
jgi:hypothetical protein